MKRAYSYVRFSRKEQIKGDSLPRQLRDTVAFCTRHKWHLDASPLHDLGVSGFMGNNVKTGALAGFMEAIRLGKISPGSVLIVESLDRLSRDQVRPALQLFLSILDAGIDIVTLTPERHYRAAASNDITELVEPLIYMSRAFEESSTKSDRLRKAWDKKRAKMKEHKTASKVCPAWLRPKKDMTGFEDIPIATATVRHIFKLASDGYGAASIAAKLNADEVPGIGKQTTWSRNYVKKILGNRAVLGEFRPCIWRDGKAVPTGEVINGYYPAILTEDEWYEARQAIATRKTQRGRRGKTVANLFTGILRDARDHCTMNIRVNGKGKRTPLLVSSGALSGQTGSIYQGFPYQTFEDTFLIFLNSLEPINLTNATDNKPDKIAALTGKLVEIEARIKFLKEQFASDTDFKAAFELLRDAEADRTKTSKQLEKARAEESTNEAETLGESQSIVRLLRRAETNEELMTLRTRLKARIRTLVKEVWLLVEGGKRSRTAKAQVIFTDGRWVLFNVDQDLTGFQWIDGPQEGMPELPSTMDLRKWRERHA